MIIAIDGPSGAGKSSVSKLVAIELGFSCLDTGAMYRSIAWQAVHDGVALDDAEALGEIARTYDIEFTHEPGNPSPIGVAALFRRCPRCARRSSPSSSALGTRAITWSKAATSARSCFPMPR